MGDSATAFRHSDRRNICWWLHYENRENIVGEYFDHHCDAPITQMDADVNYDAQSEDLGAKWVESEPRRTFAKRERVPSGWKRQARYKFRIKVANYNCSRIEWFKIVIIACTQKCKFMVKEVREISRFFAAPPRGSPLSVWRVSRTSLPINLHPLVVSFIHSLLRNLSSLRR